MVRHEYWSVGDTTPKKWMYRQADPMPHIFTSPSLLGAIDVQSMEAFVKKNVKAAFNKLIDMGVCDDNTRGFIIVWCGQYLSKAVADVLTETPRFKAFGTVYHLGMSRNTVALSEAIDRFCVKTPKGVCIMHPSQRMIKSNNCFSSFVASVDPVGMINVDMDKQLMNDQTNYPVGI